MSDIPVPWHERLAAWLAARRDTLSGAATSLVVHAILLTVLALVWLPVESVPEVFVVTVFETVDDDDDPVQFEANLDLMPQTLDPGNDSVATAPLDVLRINDVPSPPAGIDFSPVAAQAVVNDLTGQNLRMSGQLSGRGEGARGALLQAFGGTAASEATVNNGLTWLVAHQRKDGSWNFDHHNDDCREDCTLPGNLSPCTVAATSLGLLCFLGAGHTHTEGRFQEPVAKGLKYILDKAKRDETLLDLREIEGGPGMYAQGLASIVLCEAWGLSKDAALKQPAQFALNYIAAAQHPQNGGWRYEYRSKEGDTSVVGWQVMALTSGRMSDLRVPTKTRQLATKFLDTVQEPGGAFYGYTSPGRQPSTTAVGLLCRMYLGWKHDHAGLGEGVAYLSQIGPSAENLYYNYYATQVMHHWGGPEWTKWNEKLREQLVATQDHNGHAAGSWSPLNADGTRRDPHGDAGGRLYATCLSILTLEVYYRHLPLYQRQAVESEL